MDDPFEYDVVIDGMEGIPLRTTKAGAKALMTAFDNGNDACDILINAMKEGIAYKNKVVTITKSQANGTATRAKPASVQAAAAPKRRSSGKY